MGLSPGHSENNQGRNQGCTFKVIQDDSCVLVCPEIHVIFFNLTELVAKNIEIFFLKKAKLLLTHSLPLVMLTSLLVMTSQATSQNYLLLSSLIFTDATWCKELTHWKRP